MAVGFFTHGITFTLPHPKIPQRTILLLCKIIKRAWQLLQEEPPSNFFIQSADEDTITQVLTEIIENRLRKNGDVDGFDCARFGKVTREPKITNVERERGNIRKTGHDHRFRHFAEGERFFAPTGGQNKMLCSHWPKNGIMLPTGIQP